MNRIVTMCCLALAFGLSVPPAAYAQTARNGVDVLWARDVGDAELTLDGVLDEAAWSAADSVVLLYEDTFYAPGGGWEDMGSTAEVVSDPPNGTVYFLRSGNILWIGVDAVDASIGGSRDFFGPDGLVMSMVDRRNRPDTLAQQARNGAGSFTDEFFYTWRNPDDTLDTGEQMPGTMPQLFGSHGDDRELWDAMTSVAGITNSDTTGGEVVADSGYTMEIWINLETMGYDMTAAEGDHIPLTFALYDQDYAWPPDAEMGSMQRAFFQNRWGGDMPDGVGYIYGSPDVTVDSGALPEVTDADLSIPWTGGDSIAVDGMLDEVSWGAIEPQVTLKYQMTPEMMDELPGVGPYYTHWWRPGTDEELATVPVADPSTAWIKFLHMDNMLYVSLETDDQAISGQSDEARADGFRVNIRQNGPDEENPGVRYPYSSYFVVVDSSGAAKMLADAADSGAIEAAATLKGASTAADPSDVDEGYIIELAIDLDSLGYDGNTVWLSANYYDGDELDPAENSYGTWTWWLGERTTGPAATALLDETPAVAVEDTGELPERLRLMGNYPNPFNPTTTIRYSLPASAEVEVQVFDVLGRLVGQLAPGVQAPGFNELSFDASGFASGLYLYRVQMLDAATGAVKQAVTGRMMLVK